MHKICVWLLAVGLLLAMSAACSDNGEKAVGTEGASCFSNGTCHAGLTCASNLCVKIENDAAPEDSKVPKPDGAPADVQADSTPADVQVPDMSEDGAPVDVGVPDLPDTDATCAKCNEWSQPCYSSKCPAWGDMQFCPQSKPLFDSLIQCMCKVSACSNAICPGFCAGGAPASTSGCNDCLSGGLTVACIAEGQACQADQ